MNFIRQWMIGPIRRLLLLLFVPIIAAALLLLWLDAAPGKRLIERLVTELTAGGPVRVEISGIGGALPFSPTVKRLRLADADGVWLEVDDLRLALDPLTLAEETARVRVLSAGRVALLRLPVFPDAAPAESPAEGDEPPAAFPPEDLPIKRLLLDRLQVTVFEIGAAVTSLPGATTGGLLLENLDLTAAAASGDLQFLRMGDNGLTGKISVGFQDAVIEGVVTANLPDLGALAALAGQAADGRATAEVRLSRDGAGEQAATATVRAEDLTAAGVAVGDAALDVALTYAPADGGRLTVESARLAAAGTALTATGTAQEDKIQASWRLAPLQLRDLARFASDLAPDLAVVTGEFSASGEIGGTPAAPTATVQARLAGLSHPAAADGFGIKPVDVTLDGEWRDGRGVARLRTVDAAGLLRLNGEASLTDNGSKLDAKADGGVELAVLNDFLAVTGDAVSGRLTFTATAQGDPAAPRLRADFSVAGGTYRGQAAGVTFSDITLKAGWDGRRLLLERLSAKAEGGGTLNVQGQVGTTGPASVLDLKLVMRNALLVDTTLATVTADADLRLSGTAQAAKITGEATMRKVDIRIPRRLPSEATPLEVVEIGGGRPPAPPYKPGGGTVKAGVQAEGASSVALDVTVNVPTRRVRVTGQGFDGEFDGKITVRGNAAVPDVVGRLNLQRGSLKALGREFRFTRGLLIFDGGPEIDPRLDVAAETRAGGDTARIAVRGSPRRPEIAFESASGLPSDQVVSQILFGKSAERLSPGQAVELASALASLSGFEGPASLLTKLRGELGLDRLDVGTDAQGGATVEAGRSVAEGVFVGIRQGARGPQGRVEVELTDSIRVEAGVGAGGAPEVGVGFELDY